MAIGLRRKVRLDSRRDNQKITRNKNSKQKREERARRRERIIAKIKDTRNGDYSPEVKSWLSSELDKPSSQITEEDVKALLA